GPRRGGGGPGRHGAARRDLPSPGAGPLRRHAAVRQRRPRAAAPRAGARGARRHRRRALGAPPGGRLLPRRRGPSAPPTAPAPAPAAPRRLDGSPSRAPGGALPLRCRWARGGTPVGSGGATAAPAAPQTSLPLDVAGTYSVLLTAADATGIASTSPSRLDVRAL